MKDIVNMKNVDIKTVDKTQLVDIASVKINPKDTPEKKMQDYIKQVKNPYCFLCIGYVVKLEFSDGDKSIEDCLINYINSLT